MIFRGSGHFVSSGISRIIKSMEKVNLPIPTSTFSAIPFGYFTALSANSTIAFVLVGKSLVIGGPLPHCRINNLSIIDFIIDFLDLSSKYCSVVAVCCPYPSEVWKFLSTSLSRCSIMPIFESILPFAWDGYICQRRADPSLRDIGICARSITGSRYVICGVVNRFNDLATDFSQCVAYRILLDIDRDCSIYSAIVSASSSSEFSWSENKLKSSNLNSSRLNACLMNTLYWTEGWIRRDGKLASSEHLKREVNEGFSRRN
ncbi:hypothetical protein Tco_0653934 [Tanacetum coccineum]|uniref:Uncharacterized protein n=1 Tax=Tanacetum coccineum TaxID=301880 RepID=A0ABQ4X2B4_9ASTR